MSIAIIDYDAHVLSVDGKQVVLTPIEFEIFDALQRAGGMPVAKPILIAEVWGNPSFATDDALKVRINSLRKKLGKFRVKNVYGYGYVLVA